jgi:hypothetical protein
MSWGASLKLGLHCMALNFEHINFELLLPDACICKKDVLSFCFITKTDYVWEVYLTTLIGWLC